MKIEMKHDIDKNYLVIYGEKDTDYMVQMLAGKQIKGFLELEVRTLDNKNQYYYDITGMENIQQKSSRQKWSLQELRGLLSQLLDTVGKAREYLLETQHFMLEPEYLFRSRNTGDIAICYSWEYEKEINTQFTEFFAYLLNQVDYEDQAAVEFMYRLYDVSREEHCTLQRMWDVFFSEEEKRTEEIEPEEIEAQKIEESKRVNLNDRMSEKPRNPLMHKKPILESKKSNVFSEEKGVKSKKFSFSTKEVKENPKEKLKPVLKGTGNFMKKQDGKQDSKQDNKQVNKQDKKEISKAIREEKHSLGEKIAVGVALQVLLLLLFLIGIKYQIFMENGSISYTKLGVAGILAGVIDLYAIRKLFEFEESGKDTEEKELDRMHDKKKEDKIKRAFLNKRDMVEKGMPCKKLDVDNAIVEKSGTQRVNIQGIGGQRLESSRIDYSQNEKQIGNYKLNQKLPYEQKDKQDTMYEQQMKQNGSAPMFVFQSLEEATNKKGEAVLFEEKGKERKLEVSVENRGAKNENVLSEGRGEARKNILTDEIQNQKKENDRIRNTQKAQAFLTEGTVKLDFDQTVYMADTDLFSKKAKVVCTLVPEAKEDVEIQVKGFPFFIGRFQKDTEQLKKKENVSRMHCKIERQGTQFFVADLQSTNGTYVNKEKLAGKEKREIKNGDLISIADSAYVFSVCG